MRFKIQECIMGIVNIITCIKAKVEIGFVGILRPQVNIVLKASEKAGNRS
jgi:hypothetical protein